MYSVVLALHIVGGLAAGGAVAVTFALKCMRRESLNRTAPTLLVALYALAAWQMVSGSLLAILSPDVSALALCANIAIYLTVLGLTLIVLHRTLHDWRVSPVVQRIRNGFGSSLGIFIGILALGY